MKIITFEESKRLRYAARKFRLAIVLGFAASLVFPVYVSAGPVSIAAGSIQTPSAAPRAALGSDITLIHCCHTHPYAPNDNNCCHEPRYYAPGYAAPRYYAPGYNAGRAIVGGAVAYGTYKGVKKAYKKYKKR